MYPYASTRARSLLITSTGHIKLTDFGLSKIGLMNRTHTFSSLLLSSPLQLAVLSFARSSRSFSALVHCALACAHKQSSLRYATFSLVAILPPSSGAALRCLCPHFLCLVVTPLHSTPFFSAITLSLSTAQHWRAGSSYPEWLEIARSFGRATSSHSSFACFPRCPLSPTRRASRLHLSPNCSCILYSNIHTYAHSERESSL